VRSGRARTLGHLVPALLLLVAAVLPVAAGRETWLLRDVFLTHLPLAWVTAQGAQTGELPLVDLSRGGGQPLAGNLNAAPFYPTQWLLAASAGEEPGEPAARRRFLWAFNAHFWVHWLLAPLAMALLARALGLGAAGAAGAGVIYGFSGLVQSQLRFFNLLPAAVLTPLLLAAVVAALRRPTALARGVSAAAAGVCWALLLLGGEPLFAAFAALLAGSLAWVVGPRTPPGRRAPRGVGPLLLAAAAGTLLAATQVGALLQVAGTSRRGFLGYGAEAATVTSLDPRQWVDWLLPFAYGDPGALGAGGFWGAAAYTAWTPFFASLAPGLATLVLLAAAVGGRQRRDAWAWVVLAVGLFFALGRFNPLAMPFYSLSGGLVRYPIKWIFPVFLAAALLAGSGLERFSRGIPAARRRARFALLLLVALGLGALAWLWLLPAAAEASLGQWMAAGAVGSAPAAPARLPAPEVVAAERLRWARSLGLVTLAIGWTAFWLRRLARGHRPRAAIAWLLGGHAFAQLVSLAPIRATDALVPYTVPPPLLAALPPGAVVARWPGERAAAHYPEEHVRWVFRRGYQELDRFAGTLFGLRYDLERSAEGLDSYLVALAADLFAKAPPEARLRLARAWGIEFLLAAEPLPAATGVEVVARHRSFGAEVVAHRVDDPLPAVAWVPTATAVATPGAAAQRLTSEDFDPRREVLLAGPANPETLVGGPSGEDPRSALGAASADPSPARLRVLVETADRLELEVETAGSGHLLFQRAYLPLWRATVGGQPVPIVPANLFRMAIEVPAGRHRVVLEVDRRRLGWSRPLAWLGATLLLGLAVVPALGGRRSAR
jgi:hypothetical protein